MQPSEQQQHQKNVALVDWKSQQSCYHLNKMCKINTKYHFRIFMGNFKSFVYQLLIKNIVRAKENKVQERYVQDWPYRALLSKKNKTQHQLLQIEFINMCAEKIQAVFKGSITRRRHLAAFKRLKSFKDKMSALVRGWKVRRVMRCNKIREEMASIKIKYFETAKESQNICTNQYSKKRLEYLTYSLKNQLKDFQNKFNQLYSTGAWVYEPKVQFLQQKVNPSKWKKNNPQSLKQNNNIQQIQNQNQQIKIEQQVPKKKRVRQMRENVRKVRVSNKQTVDIPIQKARQIDEQIPSQNRISLQGQDRPIKAKGNYQYSIEDQINNQAKVEKKPEPEGEQVLQGNDDKKNQLKKADKKKLEKRQRYDPRKAIEDQKKRKKDQFQKQRQDKQPEIKSQNQISSTNQLPRINDSKQKDISQNRSQKYLKAKQKQLINNRSTVNIPKKAKVQPKIDCWGNRKTVSKKLLQQQSKSTKLMSKIEMEDERDKSPTPIKNREHITVEKLASKIAERRGKEKERFQYSEERQKAMEQIEKRREQSQRIREFFEKNKKQIIRKTIQQQQPRNWKSLSIADNLKERQRFNEQQRRKEVYRPVQQLQSAYSLQYINRFQNLLPKLGLLAAARKTQSSNSIPVLSLDSPYVSNMMQQNKLHQKFWYTVSKMQKEFKQFVNS